MIAGFDKYFQIVRCFRTRTAGGPPAGVHPDRYRDVVHPGGADLRGDRTADRAICGVAGFSVAGPSAPHLGKAMYGYGTDKPDLRCRRSTRWGIFSGAGLTGVDLTAKPCRSWRSLCRRRAGQPQGARRTEAVRRRARPARLRRREAPGPGLSGSDGGGPPAHWAAAADLILLAGWPGAPLVSARDDHAARLRPVRLFAARSTLPNTGCSTVAICVPVGGRVSDVRMERRGEPMGCGAPSLHLGARCGPRDAHSDPAHCRHGPTTWCSTESS